MLFLSVVVIEEYFVFVDLIILKIEFFRLVLICYGDFMIFNYFF